MVIDRELPCGLYPLAKVIICPYGHVNGQDCAIECCVTTLNGQVAISTDRVGISCRIEVLNWVDQCYASQGQVHGAGWRPYVGLHVHLTAAIVNACEAYSIGRCANRMD